MIIGWLLGVIIGWLSLDWDSTRHSMLSIWVVDIPPIAIQKIE